MYIMVHLENLDNGVSIQLLITMCAPFMHLKASEKNESLGFLPNLVVWTV